MTFSMFDIPEVQAFLKRRLRVPSNDGGAVAPVPRAGVDVEAAPAPQMNFEPMAAPPPRPDYAAQLGQTLAGMGAKAAPEPKLADGSPLPSPRMPKLPDTVPRLPLPPLPILKYGRGGTLKKKGEVGYVGDATEANPTGKEAVINKSGETEIVPIEQVARSLGIPRLSLFDELAEQQNALAAPIESPATRARVVSPEEVREQDAPELASQPSAYRLRGIDPSFVETDRTLPPGGVSHQATLNERAGVTDPIRYYDDGSGTERAVNAQTRERLAKPVEFATNRQIQRELEGAPRDNNGLLRSMGASAQRAARGGFPALLGGLIGGAVDRSADEQAAYAENMARGREQVGVVNALARDGASAELAMQKPDLERQKVDLKRRYDTWRIQSGNRKQDSLEAYRDFMATLGDRRTQTAEGQLELAREYRTVIQPEQFDRTYNQRVAQFDQLFNQRESQFTRRQSQQQRQFDQTFGLNVDKYLEGARHNLAGEGLKTFDVATKDRIPRLKSIYSEIERWQKRSAANEVTPSVANDTIEELQAEAMQIASQIEAVRDAVLSGASAPALPAPNNATPVRPNARRGAAAVRPLPSATRSAAPMLNESDIRAHAAREGLNADELVRRARARGAIR
jgi:hypothetical protein